MGCLVSPLILLAARVVRICIDTYIHIYEKSAPDCGIGYISYVCILNNISCRTCTGCARGFSLPWFSIL